MLTIKEASVRLGLDYQAFWKLVKVMKLFPEPTHQYGVSIRRYYTPSEVDGFREVLTGEEHEVGKAA
jgi:hypothetical protein